MNESRQPEEIRPQSVSSAVQRTESISHSSVSSENQETSLTAESSPASIQQTNRYVGSGEFRFPIDIIRKLLEYLDWKSFFAFLGVSHGFRSVGCEGLILPPIAPGDIQNEATLRFIAALRDEQGIYFMLRVILFESTDVIPHDDISVYILTSFVGSIVPEDTIHSMIIQIHTPQKALQIIEYLDHVVTRERFKNLKHLMLLDVPTCPILDDWIRYLDVPTLYLKFSSELDSVNFDTTLNKLKNLYVTLPCKHGRIKISSYRLKEVVVYCPKSSEITVAKKPFILDFKECRFLDLVELHGDSGFKNGLSLKVAPFLRQIGKLKWNLHFPTNGRCILDCAGFYNFKEIHVKCTSCELLEVWKHINNPLKTPSCLLPETKVHFIDGMKIPDNYPCTCGECPDASKSL